MNPQDELQDTAPDFNKSRAPYRSAGLQISSIRGAPSPNIKPTASPKSALEPLKEDETVEKPEEVVYLCDHGCGFSGSFSEVSRHEDICSFSPTFAARTPPESSPIFQQEPVAVDIPGLQSFAECEVDGPNANIAIEFDPSDTIILSYYKRTPVFHPNSQPYVAQPRPEQVATPTMVSASPFPTPTPQEQSMDMDAAATALLWMSQDLQNQSEAEVQLADSSIVEDESLLEDVLSEFMGKAMDLSTVGTHEATAASADKRQLDTLINESLNCDNLPLPSNDQASMYSTAERTGWGESGSSLFSPANGFNGWQGPGMHPFVGTDGLPDDLYVTAGNEVQADGFNDSAADLLPFTPHVLGTPGSVLASYDGKGWVEDANTRQTLSTVTTPLAVRAVDPPPQPPTVTNPVPVAVTPSSNGPLDIVHPMKEAALEGVATPSALPVRAGPLSPAEEPSREVSRDDDDELAEMNALRTKFGLGPLDMLGDKAEPQRLTVTPASERKALMPLNGDARARSLSYGDYSDNLRVKPSPSPPPQAAPPAMSPLPTSTDDLNQLRTKFGLPPLESEQSENQVESETVGPVIVSPMIAGRSALAEESGPGPGFGDSFELRGPDRLGLATVDESGTLLGVMA